MKKTLVIVIHPNISNSNINRRWIAELRRFPEKYFVHQLHEVYPDDDIDVLAEQRLVEAHDKIVFQFPFYWFNCPPMFKKWLDEVLLYGWAYGSTSGYRLAGKIITLAISAGIDEHEYQQSAKYKYTMRELTRPFELTFEYVKATYKPCFTYFGMENNASAAFVEKSVPLYMNHIDSL